MSEQYVGIPDSQLTVNTYHMSRRLRVAHKCFIDIPLALTRHFQEESRPFIISVGSSCSAQCEPVQHLYIIPTQWIPLFVIPYLAHVGPMWVPSIRHFRHPRRRSLIIRKVINRISKCKVSLPNGIGGVTGAGNICELWKNHFHKLLNCIHDDDALHVDVIYSN